MGRTMTKNSSSTASMPKTGPAVATRRRPVITPSRSSNSSGASSEQRHVVSSRVTATPNPSVAVVLAALTVGNVTASQRRRLRSSHPRRRSGRVSRLPATGWSPSEETRAAAAGDGCDVVDTLDAALARAVELDALVVLASPVTTFQALLRRIDELAPTVRLTDVASVKAVVAEQVTELASRTRYVGSHPMAGTARSGWPAGSPDLFNGA